MNFGVLSTANIGRAAVVPAIRNTDHDLLAVASRDAASADAFADEFGIPRAYGSYEELLADDELDAVYNPLPNALHAEWTKRAADAGLHVLCEKPLAVDAEEAREVGDYCADRGVTLMEAFMYRYHPRTERAAELVREELGEVRSVKAGFQFPMDDPENVRLDPDLAGGSLMDVGCYAVSSARLFLGEPDRAYATTHDAGDHGVDTKLAGVLEYDGGATAEISCGFETDDAQWYRVETEGGWLEAREAFVPRGDEGVELEYEVDGRRAVETFDPTDQYRLEVERFAACVESGEQPRTDADEAVRNTATIDALYESAERGESVAVERP
ncbi:Gfo/Idh/MocA family oxidoreductase [Halorussus gelatinilyticus]|uniref:Gfo/Idh/MocA family oxidoreductase n=1 Tax=Halorussus gelatinilyticus TaxID=2937524 RepID=A0A8U0IL18_9EURY|nr:Gfo/Idh/MocA family oxidoreductase [Halorussus gelatinilyticus]UPW01813.1 Gfo/Idh/MocA family oxidoreductase [Halorussus gelatinilyticus]